MRNMSFIMTTDAFRSGEKTVTRRLGWWGLKPGDRFMGIKQGQGLKKGEHVIRLHPAEVISTRFECLENITIRDLPLEGFPDMTTEDFIQRFMEHNAAKCKKDGRRTLVNRIQFKHLSLCPGCLYPVAYLGDYCGECLCEDDCAPD
jgi:hypothetical protein